MERAVTVAASKPALIAGAHRQLVERHVAPRIAPRELASINQWHRRWRSVTFTIAGLPVHASWTNGRPARARRSVKLGIRIGDSSGGLILPSDLVELIVRALDVAEACEIGAPGVVLAIEAAMAPALEAFEDRLGAPFALTGLHEVAPTEAESGLVFACSVADDTFAAELVGPPHWAELLGVLLRHTDPVPDSVIPLCVALRAGATRLPVGLLESLRPGDVVMLDCTALGHGRAAVVIGERHLGFARLDGGRALLASSLRPVEGDMHQVWTTTDNAMTNADDPSSPDAGLDELEVKLMFELGRLDISLGELRTVAPGFVFDLRRDPGRAVDIVAGGRRIGHGEVVQVGDALGVRIVRIFNDD
jgi:type III secretion protein Q